MFNLPSITKDNEPSSTIRDALRNTEQRHRTAFATLHTPEEQLDYAQRMRDFWATQATSISGGEGTAIGSGGRIG